MKAIKAKDLLEERYGKKGSESRERYREEAYSWYFGEILLELKYKKAGMGSFRLFRSLFNCFLM